MDREKRKRLLQAEIQSLGLYCHNNIQSEAYFQHTATKAVFKNLKQYIDGIQNGDKEAAFQASENLKEIVERYV